ncbi:MAG TPA: antitoxin VbhA family protein [Caproiciproducens sp.]|nr:antitoxin VbhA family protein [Caproiciproducens sp.]
MDKSKESAWDFALGLIKIDNLEPSPEFLKLVEKEKMGEITTKDIKKALDIKYEKLGGKKA